MARLLQVTFAALFLLLCACGAAEAGPGDYNCGVTHAYSLRADGSLGISLETDIVGSNFSVSRKTGQITGKFITTDLAMSIRVIEKGSAKNSFRAASEIGDSFRFGDGTHAYQILDVQEFREGAEKPFVVSSMGGVGIITGVCE
jgi:hypothetical protein